MFLVNKLSGEISEVKAEKRGLSRVIHAGRIYPKENRVEAFVDTQTEAKAVIKKLEITKKGKP